MESSGERRIININTRSEESGGEEKVRGSAEEKRKELNFLFASSSSIKPSFLVDEEDEEGDEDEHDNFMRKFLHSSHCTVCMYLSITLIMIGCFVALIVISVEVCFAMFLSQIVFTGEMVEELEF